MNPAEKASNAALEKMYRLIDEKNCFRIEAGAGAGKTYSLVKALNYSISKYGNLFKEMGKKIACITYTNVAKDEIIDRTEHNEMIVSETIHSFCWSFLVNFQKQMRLCIIELSEKWAERIEEYGGITNQTIVYDLGYPSINDHEITLHHDDVIKIMARFLNEPKFVKIISSLYPIIFIDEYQDTNIDLAKAIVENIIDKEVNITVGLFGDHWQKIYGSSSCGIIKSNIGKITEIGVEANFRSDLGIVNVLNKMRPELPQKCYAPDSVGRLYVFHSNDWKGIRRSESHWKGDLPSDIAKEYFKRLKEHFNNIGFEEDKTKILMLTNTLLANEQGYNNLASVFSEPDDYLKRNDVYIKFFIEIVEVACELFINKKYGDLFSILGISQSKIRSFGDKSIWNESLEKLVELRTTATIGEVIKLLSETKKPRLSPKIEEKEEMFIKYSDYAHEKKEKFKKSYERIEGMKKVKYTEVVALSKYLNDLTPFATNHGVKGAQFDNVISVFGRGWNMYNWNQMLEWFPNGPPAGKEDTFERSRNLFYVACSRAKHNLVLFFTQELSASSLALLNDWFGKSAVTSIELL